MTSRPWTEDERAYLRAHVKDQTAAALAHALGRTPNAVFTQCCRLGLVYRPSWTPEEEEALREGLRKAPLEVVAASLGRSESATRQHAQKLKIPVLTGRMFERKKRRAV